jgi:DNA polymerase-4
VVTLKIRFQGFETCTRQNKRSTPTCDEREMLKTAWQLFLEGRLPDKPVRLIGIGLSGWQEAQSAQEDLFTHRKRRQDNQRVLQTIDAVTEKFGKRLLQLGTARKP